MSKTNTMEEALRGTITTVNAMRKQLIEMRNVVESQAKRIIALEEWAEQQGAEGGEEAETVEGQVVGRKLTANAGPSDEAMVVEKNMKRGNPIPDPDQE